MTSPRSPFGAALSGINILRTPGGDVVHARESDLAVVEGRGKTSASQQWSGVVDHVEIIGGVARAKIRVDGHLVSVVITKEQVKEVSSAREVRLVLLDRESVSEV